jgi:hypothetical protein
MEPLAALPPNVYSVGSQCFDSTAPSYVFKNAAPISTSHHGRFFEDFVNVDEKGCTFTKYTEDVLSFKVFRADILIMLLNGHYFTNKTDDNKEYPVLNQDIPSILDMLKQSFLQSLDDLVKSKSLTNHPLFFLPITRKTFFMLLSLGGNFFEHAENLVTGCRFSSCPAVGYFDDVFHPDIYDVVYDTSVYYESKQHLLHLISLHDEFVCDSDSLSHIKFSDRFAFIVREIRPGNGIEHFYDAADVDGNLYYAIHHSRNLYSTTHHIRLYPSVRLVLLDRLVRICSTLEEIKTRSLTFTCSLDDFPDIIPDATIPILDLIENGSQNEYQQFINLCNSLRNSKVPNRSSIIKYLRCAVQQWIFCYVRHLFVDNSSSLQSVGFDIQPTNLLQYTIGAIVGVHDAFDPNGDFNFSFDLQNPISLNKIKSLNDNVDLPSVCCDITDEDRPLLDAIHSYMAIVSFCLHSDISSFILRCAFDHNNVTNISNMITRADLVFDDFSCRNIFTYYHSLPFHDKLFILPKTHDIINIGERLRIVKRYRTNAALCLDNVSHVAPHFETNDDKWSIKVITPSQESLTLHSLRPYRPTHFFKRPVISSVFTEKKKEDVVDIKENELDLTSMTTDQLKDVIYKSGSVELKDKAMSIFVSRQSVNSISKIATYQPPVDKSHNPDVSGVVYDHKITPRSSSFTPASSISNGRIDSPPPRHHHRNGNNRGNKSRSGNHNNQRGGWGNRSRQSTHRDNRHHGNNNHSYPTVHDDAVRDFDYNNVNNVTGNGIVSSMRPITNNNNHKRGGGPRFKNKPKGKQRSSGYKSALDHVSRRPE